MIQFLKKVVCLFRGHQWKVFPTDPHTTYACKNCNEIVRE